MRKLEACLVCMWLAIMVVHASGQTLDGAYPADALPVEMLYEGDEMRGDGALGESRTASNGQEQDLLEGLLGLQNAVSTARVLGADGQPSWRDMFNTLVKGVEEQMGKLKALAAARRQEVAAAKHAAEAARSKLAAQQDKFHKEAHEVASMESKMVALKAEVSELIDSSAAQKVACAQELQLAKASADNDKGIIQKRLEEELTKLKSDYADQEQKHHAAVKAAQASSVQNAISGVIDSLQAKARKPLEAEVERLKTEIKRKDAAAAAAVQAAADSSTASGSERNIKAAALNGKISELQEELDMQRKAANKAKLEAQSAADELQNKIKESKSTSTERSLKIANGDTTIKEKDGKEKTAKKSGAEQQTKEEAAKRSIAEHRAEASAAKANTAQQSDKEKLSKKGKNEASLKEKAAKASIDEHSEKEKLAKATTDEMSQKHTAAGDSAESWEKKTGAEQEKNKICEDAGAKQKALEAETKTLMAEKQTKEHAAKTSSGDWKSKEGSAKRASSTSQSHAAEKKSKESTAKSSVADWKKKEQSSKHGHQSAANEKNQKISSAQSNANSWKGKFDEANSKKVALEHKLKNGWTLAMKIDGNDWNKWHYSSAYWTNSHLFESGNSLKNKYFLEPANKIKLEMDGRVVEWAHNKNRSLKDLFSMHAGSNVSPHTWRSFIPNAGWQHHCNRQGFNARAGGRSARFGIVMNQENDCRSPDSSIGLGLSRGCAAGAEASCCCNGGHCRNRCSIVKVYVSGLQNLEEE